MKVYAIKNKEGKYLFTDGGYCYYFHKNIYDATFYGNKDDAMVELKYRYNITSQLSMNKNLLKTKNDFEDCEIVECTLAEGDLEKELAVYKKAISELNFNMGVISEILVSQSKKELTNAQTRNEIIKYMNKIDFIFDEVKDKLGVDVFIKLRKELGCRDEV